MDEKKMATVVEKVNAKVNEFSGSFIAVKGAIRVALTIMDIGIVLSFIAIYLVIGSLMENPSSLVPTLFVACFVCELGLNLIFSLAYRKLHKKYTEYINKVAFSTAKDLLGYDTEAVDAKINASVMTKIVYPVNKGFMD